VVIASASAVAFFDAFPLGPGHALIDERPHRGALGLGERERVRLVAAPDDPIRHATEARSRTDGHNLGVNVGEAAGQAVEHAHLVHPPHAGDVSDPRGGIRWILPERARYWESASDGRAVTRLLRARVRPAPRLAHGAGRIGGSR
jgi:diadenosine tetraphosphate (Ap4A) HIT family hydrolase